MRALTLSIFLSITGLSCSKSSSSNSGTPPPPPCTTDVCMLTSFKWEIVSQKISTDLGDYNFTTTQLAAISWASFVFRPDSTYTDFGGHNENYTYTPSSKVLVLELNLVPLNFNVAFPTKTSVTLSSDTIRVHPRTDFSVSANFAINSTMGSLYTNFGVDTSKIHFMKSVFTYNGF